MFGRVPFAFYIAHLYLAHAFAVVIGVCHGYTVSQMMTIFLSTRRVSKWVFPRSSGFGCWLSHASIPYAARSLQSKLGAPTRDLAICEILRRSSAAAHGDSALAAAGLRAYSPILVRTNRTGLPTIKHKTSTGDGLWLEF
jgi:hypothetical protein